MPQSMSTPPPSSLLRARFADFDYEPAGALRQCERVVALATAAAETPAAAVASPADACGGGARALDDALPEARRAS